MVFKRTILGVSPLIFVTVGSTNFPFDRLFAAVDKSISLLTFKPQVIVQSGNSHYRWVSTNIKRYTYLDPKDMNRIIKKANKIITHGGFGTMHAISQYNPSMSFVVPRLEKYHEQVDDHQKYFLEFVRDKLPQKYHQFFFIEGNLVDAISNYLSEKSKENVLNTYLFQTKNKEKLTEKLSEWIYSYEGALNS